MSFYCKHTGPNYHCYRLNKRCAPGEKGCVIYGKYIMPFKDDSNDDAKKSSEIDKKKDFKE